ETYCLGRLPDDACRCGRSEGHHFPRLPLVVESANLFCGKIPEREALSRRRDELVCTVACIRNRRALHLIASLESQQVLLLRRQEVGAVQREQGLSLLNRLAGVVSVQVANPSLHPEIDVRLPSLVVPHHANGPHGLLHRFVRYSHRLDANQLLTPRIDGDGSTGSACRLGGGGCSPGRSCPPRL